MDSFKPESALDDYNVRMNITSSYQ